MAGGIEGETACFPFDAATSIVAVLIWVYYSSLIIILGAEFIPVSVRPGPRGAPAETKAAPPGVSMGCGR